MKQLAYANRRAPDPDATFTRSADPTQRAVLSRLAGGELSVAELAAHLDMASRRSPRIWRCSSKQGWSRAAATRGVARTASKPGRSRPPRAGWSATARTLGQNFRRLDADARGEGAERGGAAPAAHRAGEPPAPHPGP